MSSCCQIGDASRPLPESCPSCGQIGRSVQTITLEALLTPAARRRGVPLAARACLTADCPVVYFDNATGTVFDANDLSVPVSAKRPGEPRVPVCYCFDVTPEQIENEVRRNGYSTASVMIATKVKSGDCACEIRNPKGTCCLGDVRRVEHEVEKQITTGTATGPSGH